MLEIVSIGIVGIVTALVSTFGTSIGSHYIELALRRGMTSSGRHEAVHVTPGMNAKPISPTTS